MNPVAPAAVLFAASVAAASASASVQPAYDALDRRTEAACIRASGLRDARVGPTTRFSDAFGMDVRAVTGIWPQPHMKGARAVMLCIYNRRTRQVETQEAPAMAAPAPPERPIRDLTWQAEDFSGPGAAGRGEFTVMFGSDGKLTGRSGCNQYSANYQLTGESLKVFPPMIGTRMACPPALMRREARFRDILSQATSVTASADGALTVRAPDGRSIRLTSR